MYKLQSDQEAHLSVLQKAGYFGIILPTFFSLISRFLRGKAPLMLILDLGCAAWSYIFFTRAFHTGKISGRSLFCINIIMPAFYVNLNDCY